MSATSRRVLLCRQRVTRASGVILPAFQWAGEMNKRSLQVAHWLLFSCFFFFFFNHNGGPNCCQIGQARAAFHAASGLLAFMVILSFTLVLLSFSCFAACGLQACSFSKTVLSIRGGESSLTTGNVVLTVKSCSLRNFCKIPKKI